VLTYIIRRLLQGFVVLVLVLIFTFSLPYFQSQGVLHEAYVLCGQHITHSCIYDTAAKYGLLGSYPARLWHYLFGFFFHFNLGVSTKQTPSSVSSLLALYIPRTFWLAFSSLFLAVILALPIGIYQAWRRNKMFDYFATGVAFIFYATPAFVLGFCLIELFAIHEAFGFHLPLSPPSGVHPWAMFTDPVGFLMPVAALTALSLAGLSRFMRSQVLDTLVQDYIRTARAKGCGTLRVLFRHTFRNALSPIVTIVGLSIPGLLSGALITESVFNYEGIGLQVLNAILLDDLYVVLGATVVVAVATIIGNLLADLSLVLVNPRIRIEGAAR
jgi:peptide/nickel transport system permease protein